MRTTRVRSHSSIGVLLLVLALVAAACGGDGNETESGDGNGDGSDASDGVQPVSGGRLVYGINGETNSWSPATGQWSAASWLVGSSIFDPLMYYDAELDLKPFLAESVEPNEDFTVWTITVREGVQFHNGQPLDAEALLANFEAQKASPLLAAALGPIIGMEVTGERSLEMTMANSWVHFPHGLVGQPGMMMAPEMIANPDGGREPIGTGPFVFNEWIEDDHVLVARNDDYWLAPPHLNEIEFRVMTDITSRMAAFDSGDIDITQVTGTSEATEEHPGASVLTSEVGEDQEVFLLMNQLRPPFNDLRVRRALVLATNNEEVAQVVTGGAFPTARGIYDPGSPWYVETDYPDYDLEAARQLIAELEAELGPISFTLSGTTSPLVVQGMQIVQEQWEAAGIDVELDAQELATYITTTVAGSYDVAFWQYHGAAHPDGEFVFLHSQYAAPEGQLGLNFARNVDFDIDNALLEGRYTEEVGRLRELYGTVQERMAVDLPYVFLWHVRDAILVRDSVHDVGTWEMPDGTPGADLFAARHRFHQIWID
jgi:peptide/nickel transport system substrate-binding protein